MKKIVKLTESDLTRIIKRIIKESQGLEKVGISNPVVMNTNESRKRR